MKQVAAIFFVSFFIGYYIIDDFDSSKHISKFQTLYFLQHTTCIIPQRLKCTCIVTILYNGFLSVNQIKEKNNFEVAIYI